MLIAVDPIPGMKKANAKTAIVTLRSAPDAPRYFTIGDTSSARPTSSRTDGSASDRDARSNASLASDESTLPSAQAACARTSGSGSDRARESTGTASAEPQFPSATATFRLSPAYPARRTARPLDHASHSSYDMRMRSTSRGASASRARRSGTTGNPTRAEDDPTPPVALAVVVLLPPASSALA